MCVHKHERVLVSVYVYVHVHDCVFSFTYLLLYFPLNQIQLKILSSELAHVHNSIKYFPHEMISQYTPSVESLSIISNFTMKY